MQKSCLCGSIICVHYPSKSMLVIEQPCHFPLSFSFLHAIIVCALDGEATILSDPVERCKHHPWCWACDCGRSNLVRRHCHWNRQQHRRWVAPRCMLDYDERRSIDAGASGKHPRRKVSFFVTQTISHTRARRWPAHGNDVETTKTWERV